MTSAQIKQWLSLGVIVGKQLAPLTEVKIDDKVVAIAEQLLATDALWTFLAALLDGDEPSLESIPQEHRELAQQCVDCKAELAQLVQVAELLS